MFHLTVDDVFYIRGRGTVVTGKVDEGVVRVGDEVRVGDRARVRVDGIEMFRKVLDQAEPGMNIGLLLTKLDRSEVEAGDVITGEGGDTEPAVAESAPVSRPGVSAPEALDSGARFRQAEEQREQLLSMRASGLMSDEQIDASLAALAFLAAGRQWKLTVGSDRWLSSSDGASWKHDTPPGA